MKKVTFIIVGAGARGRIYADYALHYPDDGTCVAVCDPQEDARNKIADLFDIPEEFRFRDWQDLLKRPKLADSVLVCTQDSLHREPTVELAKMGYHILLEKPMAPTPEDCRAIVDGVKRSNVILAVSHVLRYTDYNTKLRELIDSGLIGDVHHVSLTETVGYWHMAHSFVRGPWANEAKSSFMLLAKSCHDMDLLNFFVPGECKKVSSFGTLSHFKRENQPKDAADRCTDCPLEIESACPYSAIKMYMHDFATRMNTWPTQMLTLEGTREAVAEAVRTGPYGRCVYACDNDVVDHQIVNLEFDSGATASFTMSAFNELRGRLIFIMGDKGSLQCNEGDITHFDFLTNQTNIICPVTGNKLAESGHGGGDFALMRSFLEAVREEDQSKVCSGPDVTLQSHLIVFAAEKSRHSNSVEFL